MLICRMIYRLLDALLCYEIFACNSSSSPGLRRIPGTRNPERQIGWFVHRFKDVVGSEIKYIYIYIQTRKLPEHNSGMVWDILDTTKFYSVEAQSDLIHARVKSKSCWRFLTLKTTSRRQATNSCKLKVCYILTWHGKLHT